MIEEIKNIQSEEKELKKFGCTLSIIFLFLGTIFFWRQKEAHFYFLIGFILFTFLTLTYKKGLKGIYKLWMILAIILGWFMTRVILSLLFFFLATPIGFLGRLFGEKFLDLKFNRKTRTYWLRKPRRRFNKEQYKRQF